MKSWQATFKTFRLKRDAVTGVSKLDAMVKVRAVIFDVYGTIEPINDKRNPFGKLFQIGKTQGRPKMP